MAYTFGDATRGNRPRLIGVSLCAIESRPTLATLRALLRSIAQVECDKVLYFSPVRPELLPEDIEHIAIPRFANISEYSTFMLLDFGQFVTSRHVLLIQWDGFVIDSSAWDDDFLEYDYVGAPWPQFTPPYNVGNGGFSLRSRRLLTALRDPEFLADGPEDVAICRTNRAMLETKHDIRFAPHNVASRFSYEHGEKLTRTFGFHGLFNFPDVFKGDLVSEIEELEDFLLKNRDARLLLLELRKDDKFFKMKHSRQILYYLSLMEKFKFLFGRH